MLTLATRWWTSRRGLPDIAHLRGIMETAYRPLQRDEALFLFSLARASTLHSQRTLRVGLTLIERSAPLPR